MHKKNAADGGAAQTRELGNGEAGESDADARIVQSRQAFLLITAGPLGGGASADMESASGSLQSHPLNKDVLCQLLSTDEGKSCILMNVHSAF